MDGYKMSLSELYTNMIKLERNSKPIFQVILSLDNHKMR